MPTDRLFKFSIPGLMFLLTFVFFYDFFGGDLNELLKWTNDKSLFALFGLIFSTPIIGVVFSTIALGFLQLLYGYRILYYPPDSIKIIEHALAKYQNLKDRVVINGKANWTKATIREFYPYYQLKVREHLGGEQISFLDRRWSVYWTHVNNISMSIFSFAIAGFLSLFDDCNYCCVICRLKSYQVIGALTLIIYCISGYFNLKSSKKDATDVEHLMLENAIDNKKEQGIRERENNSPTWTSLLTQLLKILK